MDVADFRRDYTLNGLSKENLKDTPSAQFELWFQQAVDAALLEPNAMSLTTVDANGQPNIRTVLMKKSDERGIVFFTNYESQKAKEITANPKVAVLFPWIALERQVKILGTVEKISKAESLSYFISRPFGSRLGAWVSEQSSVISSRALLEEKLEQMKRKFADGEVPLPSFWGGYRVVPHLYEFWQGRQNRLHDRFQYTKQADGSWEITRLAP